MKVKEGLFDLLSDGNFEVQFRFELSKFWLGMRKEFLSLVSVERESRSAWG